MFDFSTKKSNIKNRLVLRRQGVRILVRRFILMGAAALLMGVFGAGVIGIFWLWLRFIAPEQGVGDQLIDLALLACIIFAFVKLCFGAIKLVVQTWKTGG